MTSSTGRICVDVRSLEGEGTGIATYTRGLMAAIETTGRQVGSVGATGRYYRWLRALRAMLPWRVRLAEHDGGLIGWDIFRLAQVRFSLCGRILRLRAPGPPGVMHWPYPVPLMIEGWRNIYTVHDTIPLRFPHLTSIDSARHLRLLQAVAGVADHILTVSDAAAADIADLGWPAGRVVNCSQAVTVERSDTALPEGCEAGRYLVFCGRLEERKNIPRLIAAYGASGSKLPLLLTGPVVEGGPEILETALNQAGVRHLAYLDRLALIALIAHARALLLPSLAEGFGLPVVEAMALGTPTLISMDPALVETAGGAALIVDGESEIEMADGIARLSTDDLLCADLSSRGRERAANFSVGEFGARLSTLYSTLRDDADR